MDYEYITLYENALALFRKAGFTANLTPLSANHSFKQVVYLDSEKTIYVDQGTLNCAFDISHLFDLGDAFFVEETGSVISFYSVQLNCLAKHRSQMAHDIHSVLHASFSTDISVILFYHDANVMISIAGVDEDVILSEWYDFFYDFDKLADLLNIGQFSISSSHQFIIDLIYTIARAYYLEPDLEGLSVYSIIPLTYYGNGPLENDNAEGALPLKEFIVQSIRDKELEYGDDYVQSEHGIVRDMSAIEDELARLSFELELQEEETEAPNFLEGTAGELEHDDYEYEDIDPEVFDDPTLMLQWLDSQSLDATGDDLSNIHYEKSQANNTPPATESEEFEQLDMEDVLRQEEQEKARLAEEKRRQEEAALEQERLQQEKARLEEQRLAALALEEQKRIEKERINNERELRQREYEAEYHLMQQKRKEYYDAEIRNAQKWFQEETRRSTVQYQNIAKSKKEKVVVLQGTIKEKKLALSKLLVIQFIKRSVLEKEINQAQIELKSLVQELSEIEQKHNITLANIEKQFKKRIRTITENAVSYYPLPKEPEID